MMHCRENINTVKLGYRETLGKTKDRIERKLVYNVRITFVNDKSYLNNTFFLVRTSAYLYYNVKIFNKGWSLDVVIC